MSTVPAAGSTPPSSEICRRSRCAIGTPRVWMPTSARRSSSALPSTISCAIRRSVRAIASESSRTFEAEISAGWRKPLPSRPHGTGLKDEARGTVTPGSDGVESGAALGREQGPEGRERAQRQHGEAAEADPPRGRLHEGGEGERRDDRAEAEGRLLETECGPAPLAAGELGGGGEREPVPADREGAGGDERCEQNRIGCLCQQRRHRHRRRQAEAQSTRRAQAAADPVRKPAETDSQDGAGDVDRGQNEAGLPRREPSLLVQVEDDEAGQRDLDGHEQGAARRQLPEAPVAERAGDVAGDRLVGEAGRLAEPRERRSGCGCTRDRERAERGAEPVRRLERRQDDGAEAASDGHGRLPDPEREPALARGKPRHDRTAGRGVDGGAHHPGQRHDGHEQPEVVDCRRHSEQQRGPGEPDRDHRPLPHAVGKQPPAEQRQRHAARRGRDRDAERAEADVEPVRKRRREDREREERRREGRLGAEAHGEDHVAIALHAPDATRSCGAAGRARPHRGPSGAAQSAAATGDGSVSHEQHERPDDRRDPRADVEELVDRIAEAERLGDETPKDRPDDADDRRDDDPTGVVTRQEELGDDACKQAQHDPPDDSHASSSFVVRVDFPRFLSAKRACSSVFDRSPAGRSGGNGKQAEEEVRMEPNEQESNEQDEGGLKKKVATGVAVGLATTAAAGVAKKLLGSDDDDQSGDVQETAESQGRQAGSTGGRTAQDAQSRATGQARSTARSTRPTTKAAAGSAKKRSSQARSTAKKRSSQAGSTAKTSSSQARSAAKKSSSRTRSSAKATTRSASSTASRERTKEQLYKQAKRLEIEGRSNMTKAQLERAIERAK